MSQVKYDNRKDIGAYLKANEEHILSISDPELLTKLSQLGPFYAGMNAIEKALSDIRIHGKRYLAMVEILNSLDMCIKHDPLNILEIGCNTGFLSLFIKNHHPHYNVVALDRAPAQIKANKLIGSTYIHKVEFLTMDGASATEELGHNQFDVVFLCEILEHLEKDSALQHKVLLEALSCTLHNGIVVVTVPYEDQIPSPGHLTEFTRKTLRELLKSGAKHVMDLNGARKHFGLEKHLIFLASNQAITPNLFQ